MAQPTSASNALQTFLSGQGDVLLDYEDDALYAKSQGEPVTVITPPQTILIQNPIAVTTNAANPTAAKAFVAYLLSPAGQKIWGQQGYRPVLPKVAAQFNFPKPKVLFTIDIAGRLDKGQQGVLHPDDRRRGQDRAGARGLDRRVADVGSARRPPGRLTAASVRQPTIAVGTGRADRPGPRSPSPT